jgi:hypothetical protein
MSGKVNNTGKLEHYLLGGVLLFAALYFILMLANGWLS